MGRKSHAGHTRGGRTVAMFPWYPEQMKNLVASHAKLKEHPLQLAIWYDTDHPKNLCLLEVLKGFPSDESESELYTSKFTSTSEFLIADGGELVLTLSGPKKMELALEKRTPLVRRIRASFKRKTAKVMFQPSTAPTKRILRNLRNG